MEPNSVALLSSSFGQYGPYFICIVEGFAIVKLFFEVRDLQKEARSDLKENNLKMIMAQQQAAEAIRANTEILREVRDLFKR